MKTVLFRVAEDLAIRAETRPVVFVAKAIIVSEGVGTWPVVSSRCRLEVQLSCISWWLRWHFAEEGLIFVVSFSSTV
jgi:hypothetical protein